MATADEQRVLVYLGASAPVHATHTRLVRALLDEGADKVFVFLLRWSPDRHGVTADAGLAQLRRWCDAALPAADRARLELRLVQHDHEGGAQMRAALGAGADPAVEVCFSQKYAGQEERIAREWLPLYTAEFPRARPRFLTDATDPGAAARGTAAFVDCVKRWQAARGTADADAAAAALDAWRPEFETADGWARYVDELLTGGGGDPLYTAAELAEHEGAFFGDSASLGALDAAWRASKIPGGIGFLKDQANWRAFWKKHAIPSDHAVFKQFVLRRQGVVKPSALEALPAMAPLPDDAGAAPYAVLAAPAMHQTAERLAVAKKAEAAKAAEKAAADALAAAKEA